MKLQKTSLKRESSNSLLSKKITNPSIPITNKEFEQISRFIESSYGIKLKEEKKSLVMSRLSRVLHQKNMRSFSEYFEHILLDRTGKEASELINKITTNHTYFMRESKHWIGYTK